MVRKFSLALFAVLACAGFASAQCSNGSCSAGRAGSARMMSMPTMMQAGGGWGQAPAQVERVPTIAFEMQSLDTFVNLERARRGLQPVVVTKEPSDAAWTAISPAALSGDDAKKLGINRPHAVAVGHKTPFAAFQAWMGNAEIASMITSDTYHTCGVSSVRGSDGNIHRVLIMGPK